MLVSVIRFISNGWIESQYLIPEFHFSYYGFSWIQPLGETGMYLLFGLMVVSAIGITLGLFYRIAAIIFFLSFTYVELIDVTNYLNHYYFVSLMGLILVFLPAHRDFSLDVWRKASKRITKIPYGFILVVQLLLAMVYFYAGIAKLHPDWLFHAQPLRMWLPLHSHLPLIGGLMDQLWVAFAFSWFGAIYDLTIPFFLFYRKTRLLAFAAVVVFHVTTWILFPIGMFPFIMILSTTIFFSGEFHEKIRHKLLGRLFNVAEKNSKDNIVFQPIYLKALWCFFGVFLLIQTLLPWRFMLYPGNLFWTEEGYRFSWRVMLMEKAGYAIFHVTDKNTGKQWEIYAHDYLSPMQEKQMSTQPDLLLQYAHFLKRKLEQEGFFDVEIRAEVYVTLNGRENRLLLDPTIDLTQETDSFKPKKWILPYAE